MNGLKDGMLTDLCLESKLRLVAISGMKTRS